jgi:predicted nucleic acid-binding protein
MFLLDTNVVSELRRPDKTNPRVKAWADNVPVAQCFLSAITILEIEHGALLIARKDAAQGALLRTWIDRDVLSRFAGRVLPIDTAIAQRCAQLHVPNPRSDRDAMIAATALEHGMSLVTRNVADFAGMRVKLVNPWVDPS